MKKKLSIVILGVIALVVVAIPLVTKAQNANVSVINKTCEYRTNTYYFIEPVMGAEISNNGTGKYTVGSQSGTTRWSATFHNYESGNGSKEENRGWELREDYSCGSHGHKSKEGCLYYEKYGGPNIENVMLGPNSLSTSVTDWLSMAIDLSGKFFDTTEWAYDDKGTVSNVHYYSYKHQKNGTSSEKAEDYTDDKIVYLLRENRDAFNGSRETYIDQISKSIFSLNSASISGDSILDSNGNLKETFTVYLTKNFPDFTNYKISGNDLLTYDSKSGAEAGNPFRTNIYQLEKNSSFTTPSSDYVNEAKSKGWKCSDDGTYIDPYKYCEAYAFVIYEVPLQKCTTSVEPSTGSYMFNVYYEENTSDDVDGMPGSHSSKEGYCAVIKKNVPTRDGYTFLGWSTNKFATEPDCNYTPLDNNTAAKEYCSGSSEPKHCGKYQDDNLTLYAIWRNNSNGRVETPEDNNAQSPRTGVGIAYTLIGTILVCSTGAILYIRKKNKFSDI